MSPAQAPTPRRPIPWILIGILGTVLWAIGISRSLTYALPQGAVDFRNRVVAARQAERGLDPYLFKWTPEYPDTLLDPSDEVGSKYSRMTSPPSTLAFHSLFANVDYGAQKSANFFLSWIFLLFVPFWLILRGRGGLAMGKAVAIAAFVGGAFAASGLWLFHVERGQQYSSLAALLALSAFPPLAGRAEWARPLFEALSVLFRPSLGLAAFLSLRDRRAARSLAWAAGIGAFLLALVLMKYPLSWWGDYLASAKDWYLHRYGLHHRIVSSVQYPAAPEGNPAMARAIPFAVPGNILQHYLGKAGPIPASLLSLLTLGVTAFSGWTLWRCRKEEATSFALRFFSGTYLIDLALPAPRSGYNAVLFLPGLILAFFLFVRTIETDPKRKSDLLPAVLIAIGLLFSLCELEKPFTSPLMTEAFYALGAIAALARSPRPDAAKNGNPKSQTI